MACHPTGSIWERKLTLCMCICCISSCAGAAEPAMLGIAPGIMPGCIPEAAIIICAETLLGHPSNERSSTPVSPIAPTQEAVILIIRHTHELAPSQDGLDLEASSCTHSTA